VVKATEKRIESALQREREPSEPIRPETRTKFINPSPATAPSWFQDRHVETRLVGDFLQDDALRLMTIAGRGGIGKTAMVCRLLKSLESGKLPDDLGPMSVDGIVYLSPFGSRQLSFAHLYTDLCKLLPDKQAETLLTAYKNPQASAPAKMQALLEAFPAGRTMVLLDNLETVLDSESGEILEEELGEALVALLSVPHHGVKTIITTRVPPRALLLKQPGRQTRLDLDEGLASPYAENILREMDPSGKLGLKAAPAALLDDARERTRGFPRALEALAGILAADRDTSLPELLEEIEKLQPGEVVEALVGEAFSRLDPLAQQVMQALAIYAYPVVPGAIDYLLKPYVPSIDSTPVLRRLVNMQFARSEAGRYHLHHVDREYALSRIPRGEESDRDAAALPFSQFALLKRAADYFEKTRTPRESWKSIGDLGPQLAEFELRVAGGEYDAAASVLLEIDFDYLLLWGHVRDAAQLHERLRGHLGDARLRGASLNNLGVCYFSLGQYTRAMEHYEQTLTIARAIGDRGGEGSALSGLGLCYDSLGQYARAIEHHEQHLAIAREVGDRQGEGSALNNLGVWYLRLGQYARPIERCEQRLAIARETGAKYGEAISLTGLADIHRAVGEPTQARQEYEDAIRVADAIRNVQNQVESRYGLAVLQLDVDDLAAAHETIAAVRRFNYPAYWSSVCALSGVVALRLGDVAAARADFSMSLTEAETLLTKHEHNLNALDTKGLALSGLVLCGDRGRLASHRSVSRGAGYQQGPRDCGWDPEAL
jgi:tetratricopeptide (TPR) repeat protein